MKKLLLLFSHNITDIQKEDAEKSLNVEKIIKLSEKLQDYWSNVIPEKIEIEKLNEIKKFVLDNLEENDYALIQGEWGYVYTMVNFCKENHIIPIYSTTKRDVIEEIQKDGSIKKTSNFKHVKYNIYENL